MEILYIRSCLEENKESKMTIFLNGLNKEIQDMVELQKSDSLEDLLQKALKVERQIKRHKKYASWNASKDIKEDDKSLQGKFLNHHIIIL